MLVKSLSILLSILITLKLFLLKNLSFFLAATLRFLPHFSVESISIHRLGLTKKSILYGPIGFCISKSTEWLSRICLNFFSCGHNLFVNVLDMVSARLFEMVFCFIGLFALIRLLFCNAQLEFSFVKPIAQCLLCVFFAAAASFEFLVDKLRFLHNLYIASLETFDLFDIHKIDLSFSQCKTLIISSKDILKYDSILSNISANINARWNFVKN